MVQHIGMKYRFKYFAFLFLPATVLADNPTSILKGNPTFSTGMVGGPVVTGKYVNWQDGSPIFNYTTFRFGYIVPKGSSIDMIFKSPQVGIGALIGHCERGFEFGNPVALYLYQGAKVKQFSEKISLDYLLSLGSIYMPVHYDPVRYPDKYMFGNGFNIFLSYDLNVVWRLSEKIDFKLGVNASHISNGNTREPNNGINNAGLLLGIAYRLASDRNMTHDIFDPQVNNKKWVHDVAIISSSRNRSFIFPETEEEIFTKRSHHIWGVSYSASYLLIRRLTTGLGAEFIYDNSAGVHLSDYTVIGENKVTGHVTKGPTSQRLCVSPLIIGEYAMPYYSIFLSLNYALFGGYGYEKKFHQVAGVKIPFSNGLYGAFGITAYNLSKAEHLYFALGIKI